MQQHDSIKAQACIGLGDFGHTDIWVERSNLWYDKARVYLEDKGQEEQRNTSTIGLNKRRHSQSFKAGHGSLL